MTARSLRRLAGRLLSGRSSGSARIQATETQAERHRQAGTKVGCQCRIYGTIDKVNPHLVEIGDYCVLGTASALLAHCPLRGASAVKLGDFVWIGFNALVLPGVEIGACSIVGAGSVVTKSVPPRSIVAGNPARVLRSLTDEEAESLAARLRSGRPIGKDENVGIGTGDQ